MKFHFKTIGIFILFFAAGIILAKSAKAEDVNLINNPSVENVNASSTSPSSWQTDIWGMNNATLTYEATGYQSDHSVLVKMANYASGDAKWYFDPVAVEPNQDYIFTDFYKSNVKTQLVAMSLDQAGAPTYFDVARVVPISADWREATYTFRTLPNTKTITILHIITRNGWVQTDNFSLVKNELASIIDLVPNNSVEIKSSNKNLPRSWKHSRWGTLKTVWQYANDGYDGGRSVKLTVSNYVSGDAKWVYTPMTLERGKDYRFSAMYKTNTNPHVVVQYIKEDGTEDFFGMPDPQPKGTDWQKYSDTFSVPMDAKSVSVFMLLNSNGWLQTDDYHVTPYNYVGFDKGRVTLTFDDGFESNINTVLPVFDKYKMEATICNATSFVEGIPEQEANIQTFANHGHEICSHSVNHPDLTTQTSTQVNYELDHSQRFLQNLVNQPITNFVSPFGAYNASVNEEIMKYYLAHRTTDEGFNSKDNFNPYRLRVQNMKSNTTLEQFQAWVNEAKADKTWLILLYHVVDNTGIGEYDTYKADFDKQMEWLANSGVTIQRMDNALRELKAQ
ncbi:MAG: polysaccharide deacetylase family protein [Bacillota bacterium]